MKQPLVVAYGLGVDSTAALIGLHEAGERPDLILFADTGNEKQETYDYLPVIQRWLEKVKFPQVQVVRRVIQTFKHWPAYTNLGDNCLTNGTLPSLAFGFKGCSLKWKAYPQEQYTNHWQPAIDCWARGGQVRKVIGYDASPNDRKRHAHTQGMEDTKYDYWYPLIEWGWERERCKEEIRKAGLPVPPKSACYFCPASHTYEIRELKKVYLRYIVVMEARAMPRLTDIGGLWRTGRKGTRGGEKRPASMTQFIREEGLLPAAEIDDIIARTSTEIVPADQSHRLGLETPSWHDFIEAFTPEDALDEIALPGRIPLAVLDAA